MKRPTLLPEHQLETVVAALYAQADDAGWDNLGPRDRSRMYSDWVEPTDPIGKILAQYMTPEAARSWIKDGPMKEYARANRGTGRYASFGRRGGTTPADIVRHALGETAQIVPGTTPSTTKAPAPWCCGAIGGRSRTCSGRHFEPPPTTTLP